MKNEKSYTTSGPSVTCKIFSVDYIAAKIWLFHWVLDGLPVKVNKMIVGRDGGHITNFIVFVTAVQLKIIIHAVVLLFVLDK